MKQKISKPSMVLLLASILTGIVLAQTIMYSLIIDGTVTTPIGYDLQLRVSTGEVASNPVDFDTLARGEYCVPKDPQTPSDSRFMLYNSGLEEAIVTPNFTGIPTGFTLQIYIDATLTILWSPGTQKSLMPGNSITIWIKLTNVDAAYGQTYNFQWTFDVVE